MAALRSRLAISQLIVFLLIGNKQVDAQNGNGCISGSVVDSKHNGVSGATVKAQGISGSEREPTRTKSDGSFILADIRTGKISVTAFKKLDEENYWFGKAATWPI